MTSCHPELGSAPFDFSVENHLGSNNIFLARAEKGRWVTFTDVLTVD